MTEKCQEPSYTYVPLEIIRSRLISTIAKIVWIEIATCTSEFSTDILIGWSPSIRAIAVEIGVDTKTVVKCLKELENAGYLKIEKLPGFKNNYVIPHIKRFHEAKNS